MIAGVDGTRSGWVAVLCEDDLSRAHAVCLDRLIDLPRRLRVVAVDIPIGLSEKGPRQADHLARKALGSRRSSVFPTPVRAVLGAKSWRAACIRNARADGRRVSKQTFAILPKISEADAFVRSVPWARRTLYEVHPELSFATLAGAPMSHPKKAPAGRVERLALISATFGHGAFDNAYARVRGLRVGWDDLADAFALAWTAGRIRAGIAKPHPAEQVVDSEGVPMRIWT
jgi:predicted RNase H-like nuclease